MKKLLNIAFAGLFMALLFTSCSSDEEIITGKTHETNSIITVEETRLAFEAFNDSLRKTIMPITKAEQTKLSKFDKLRIVIADAKGAKDGVKVGSFFAPTGVGGVVASIVGGVTFGAAKSIAAYVKIVKKKNITLSQKGQINHCVLKYSESKDDKVRYIDFDLPKRREYYNELCGMHNTIVAKSLKEINGESEEGDIFIAPTLTSPNNIRMCKAVNYTDFLVTQVSSITEYNVAEAKVLKSDDFLTAEAELGETFDTEFLYPLSETTTTEGVYDLLLYPEEVALSSHAATIYNSFIRIVFEANTLDEIINFTNLYAQKVEQQITLTYAEKDEFFIFLSMFGNSIYYWSTVENN